MDKALGPLSVNEVVTCQPGPHTHLSMGELALEGPHPWGEYIPSLNQ